MFKKFNECNKQPYHVYEDRAKSDNSKLRFSIFAGYNFNKFQIKDVIPTRSIEEFNSPSIGIEGELLILSDKLGVFLSAEYKHLKGESGHTYLVSQFNQYYSTDIYKLDTGVLDFVLGARYYMNFDRIGSLYAGFGVGMDIPMEKLIREYSTNSVTNIIEVSKIKSLQSNPFVRFQVGYI